MRVRDDRETLVDRIGKMTFGRVPWRLVVEGSFRENYGPQIGRDLSRRITPSIRHALEGLLVVGTIRVPRRPRGHRDYGAL